MYYKSMPGMNNNQMAMFDFIKPAYFCWWYVGFWGWFLLG